MMSFAYWTHSCLWSSDNACGTNREATFLSPKSSTKIWRIVSLLTPNSSAIILTLTQCSSCILFLTFTMSPSLRTENGRPGLTTSSIVSTPPLNRVYRLNICARDNYPCTIVSNSTVSVAIFPSLKQNLMFAVCCMPLIWWSPVPSQHGAVFPVMLSVGCCSVVRLQMKVGRMDGMHCFIDSTLSWSK